MPSPAAAAAARSGSFRPFGAGGPISVSVSAISAAGSRIVAA